MGSWADQINVWGLVHPWVLCIFRSRCLSVLDGGGGDSDTVLLLFQGIRSCLSALEEKAGSH